MWITTISFNENTLYAVIRFDIYVFICEIREHYSHKQFYNKKKTIVAICSFITLKTFNKLCHNMTNFAKKKSTFLMYIIANSVLSIIIRYIEYDMKHIYNPMIAFSFYDAHYCLSAVSRKIQLEKTEPDMIVCNASSSQVLLKMASDVIHVSYLTILAHSFITTQTSERTSTSCSWTRWRANTSTDVRLR